MTLINLEVSIYEMPKLLGQLYHERRINDRRVVLSQYAESIANEEKEIKLRKEQVEKIKTEIENVEKEIDDLGSHFDYFIEEDLYGLEKSAWEEELEKAYVLARAQIKEPEWPKQEKVPLLFGKNEVIKRNKQREEKYHEEYKIYKENLKSYKEKLKKEIDDKYNEKFKKIDAFIEKRDEKKRLERELLGIRQTKINYRKNEPSAEALMCKDVLDKDIAQAEDMLKKMYEARNQLYATDIVFSKYQNVVALSSFYEYLMSGRCSTLEGANGAYNLYESEIRANLVISQLDQVLNSMEQIKKNQYMIYTEMQNTNKAIKHMEASITNTLESIRKSTKQSLAELAESSAVIAHNTETAAYYAKKTSQLTNALGYLVALN